MPEGDTIHRRPRHAAPRAGGTARRPRSRRRAVRAAPPAPGERVERVEARGKHLLIALLGRRTLHTHMRMTGSLAHVPGRRALAATPRGSMVVRIATDDAEAVCFSAPVVQLLDAAGSPANRSCARSAPTCASAELELEDVLARLAALDPATPIGVALLDQRVAAGIGNVYKSEILWACGVDPFTPLEAIAPDDPARAATHGDAASSGPTSTRRSNAEPSPRASPSTTGPDALPALRHPDRVPPSGRPGAHHLVVPRLPDLTPHGTRSHRSDAGPPPPRTGWRPTAGAIAFERGGNAIDAALAAATTLAVVYPHMCGVGGDLFALVQHRAGDVVAVNASGRAPAGADPAAATVAGGGVMPEHGPHAVTVPGRRERMEGACTSKARTSNGATPSPTRWPTPTAG